LKAAAVSEQATGVYLRGGIKEVEEKKKRRE
jgi:hypothetical protein